MDKKKATSLIKEKYPNLVIDSIVEEKDKFYFQLGRKDNEILYGGIKSVDKTTGKIKGLISKLMEAVK